MITQVIKRDGQVQDFDECRIRTAIIKCLRDGLGESPDVSGSIADRVSRNAIVNLSHTCKEVLSVEEIQNIVEEALMEQGHFDAARLYIQYRQERAKAREVSKKKTIDPEYEKLVAEDRKYFPKPSQYFQYLDKYSRYLWEKGRRETWSETVDRAITFLQEECGKYLLLEEEWNQLRTATLNLEVMPSMRLIQMAGPAAKRCHSSTYNCWAIGINDLRCFSEMLYLLMQGGGVGFSVESEFVEDLPRIKKQKNLPIHKYVIQDSTEGWCDALLFGLETWYSGEDVEFDYSLIRPEGSPLITKGGKASGPRPLKDMLDFTRARILERQGKRLRPIDCHDICCKLGQIVKVGGVRRAAQLSLFDQDDMVMRHAKHGEFWKHNLQRTQSNNSVVFEEKPSIEQFLTSCWLPLLQGGTGEPGIFNRQGTLKRLPKRRKKVDMITNPCGEVLLRVSGQACNLSMVIVKPWDTYHTLEVKVKLATIYGTLQSMLTKFQYLRPIWAANCEEERLLGVDINGWEDNPLTRYGANGRKELMEFLRGCAVETNQVYADRFGIQRSTAVTTGKPDGNSSELCGTSSGAHRRPSKYYIRRMRAGRHSPVTKLLQDAGVPWHIETGETEETHMTVVFEFPTMSPDGSSFSSEISAKDQFLNWLELRKYYCEHNQSYTCYVKEDEWLELGALVYENWEDIGGISFLPKSAHIYLLPPYESISEEKYLELVATFPEINFSALPLYEDGDETTGSQEVACSSGRCDIV